MPRLTTLATRAGLLAVATTAIAGATSAQAAVFCVGKPDCSGTSKPTLKDALDATNLPANPGPDRVELGDGEFAGPAIVKPGSGAEIVGAGRGRSTIVGTTGLSILDVHDPNVHISDLTVRMTDATSVGIDLNQPGAVVERVDVAGPPTVAASKTGLMIRRGATVRDSTVVMNTAATPTNYGISLAPSTTPPAASEVLVERVQVAGGYGIYDASWPAPVTVRNAVVTGGTYGVAVSLPSPQVRLEQIAARVEHTGPYDAGAALGITTPISAAPGETNVTARNLTLVSRGHGGAGLHIIGAVGQPVKVMGREIVALGGADWAPNGYRASPIPGEDPVHFGPITTSADLKVAGQGPVDLHLAESAWRGKAVLVSNNTGRIADDGGNLLPAPGSVLIDNGTRDAQAAGDAVGNPRPVDGDGDGDARNDIGAYEAGPGSSAGHVAPYWQAGSCDAACTAARKQAELSSLPTTKLGKLPRKKVRTLAGTAQRTDSVYVSITRVKGKACQAMTAKHKWAVTGKPSKGHCGVQFNVPAKTLPKGGWSLTLPRALARGTYDIAASGWNGIGRELEPVRKTVKVR